MLEMEKLARDDGGDFPRVAAVWAIQKKSGPELRDLGR